MTFPVCQHILVNARSFPTALSGSLLLMYWKRDEGQDFPWLEMWVTLILRHQKSRSLKEAWPGGGKAVVQVLLKPHPAVGSQVWHSKSLALFKFGLKIPMKSYSTCWVTTFHNVITWPFQRLGFRSTYYWLKACQISFFLSKLQVMIHGDSSILFLIRCCSPVHETKGKQSDILKKYVLARSWGIQSNTQKAFWH